MPTTPTSRQNKTRPSNRARRPIASKAQPTFFERYRVPIIAGVGILIVALVGYFFLTANNGPQGSFAARGPQYLCDTLLTPGPSDTLPPPVPSITPSPSQSPSPSAAPSTSAASAPASGSVTPASPSSSAVPGSTSASTSPAASASASASVSASASAAASPTTAPTPTPAPTLRLGFTTQVLGRTHVTVGSTIEYGFCPPTSGNHYNQPPLGPVPAAVYPPTSELPPGEWVHNLEHGYVVLAYRCPSGTPGVGDCISAADYAQLQAFHNQAPDSGIAGCPNKTVVARFDSMTTNFAELAWGRALLTNSFDLNNAETFVKQWMNGTAAPESTLCDNMTQ